MKSNTLSFDSFGTIPSEILKQGEWDVGSSKLEFFARYNGLFNIVDVDITSHVLRKLIKRNYEFTSRNIFLVSTLGHSLLKEKKVKVDAVNKSQVVIDNSIQNAADSIQLLIKHATLAMGANNVHIADGVCCTHKISVPVVSLAAQKYVALFVMADEFLNLNAHLLKTGLIDKKHSFKNDSAVRLILQGVMNGITSQFRFMLNLSHECRIHHGEHEMLASDAQ